MAAGFLSPPGGLYGPCEGECHHVDCIEARELAEDACSICGEPIGWDTRFYRVDDGDRSVFPPVDPSYAHATCEERRVEGGS